jgi:hypothetical protein
MGLRSALSAFCRGTSAATRLTQAKPSPAYLDLMERFGSFTMTSRARQTAFLAALDKVFRQDTPGDIVECGVWRGGMMLMAAAARMCVPMARSITSTTPLIPRRVCIISSLSSVLL